ncbi:MAG: maltose ABC transporter substrate-binding protein [Bifidobacteriaceae bacterium]|jgi:arabinogalactan oligomer/maltooligosaccharide transport system substrate-binding protein|nr:maltose ABC transporter substrate-binding protein [Bifidobacteriaceae bacterium]
MKRLVAVAVVALGLSAGLAACGGGDKGGSDSSGTTQATDTATDGATSGGESTPADGDGGDPAAGAYDCSDASQIQGTITVWVDETRITALKPAADTFCADTGVKVDLVQKVFDDLRKDFASQVAAGSGPDITVGANDWLGEFKTNGLIQPIDLSGVADQLTEASVAAFSSEGQAYGVPYGTENIALVRNNALISETKATTFDELIEEGKSVGKQYSVIIPMGEAGDAYHMYPIQASFGAPVFETDANGDYTSTLAMGGDAGHNFATYLAKLGQEGVVKSTITGDILSQAFTAGEAPYVITGPWNTSSWVSAGMDISVLPIPSAGGQPAAPFMGVQGFYLSANAQNSFDAQTFLVEYLTKADIQLELYKLGGRMPANKEALADPSITDDPVAKGFAEAAGDAIVQPSIPAMNSVWGPWGLTEVAIADGKVTDPAAAWDQMISDIEKAITEAAE